MNHLEPAGSGEEMFGMDQNSGNDNDLRESNHDIEVMIPVCFSDEIKVDRNVARQMMHPPSPGILDLTGPTPI